MAVPVNNYDAFTNEFFIKKLQDQFFLKSPLLKRLRATQKTFDGGSEIRVPVTYKPSPNAGAWGGRAGVLPTSYVEHATHAIFEICYYYASITMPKTEEWLNRGQARIVNMLKAQIELAEQSLVRTLGRDIYSDGTNNSDGYKRVDGLQALATRNGDGSEGAFGDISRASSNTTESTWTDNGTDNSWWNCNVFAANANTSINFWKGAATIGNTTTVSYAKLQQQYGLACDGSSKPTAAYTGQLVFDALHALTTAIQRQPSNELKGRAGFQELEFNGIPFYVDDLINAAGTVYMINEDHLTLMVHDEADFFATPWRQPTNQLMDVKFIISLLNLTSDKPRAHSVQTGFTG